MRYIAIASIVAAAAALSSPAAAGCVDDWEGRTSTVSGLIRDIDQGSGGWTIDASIRMNDGCAVAEMFAGGSHPAQCRVDGRFTAAGHFHYIEDDEYHSELRTNDVLAFHAERIHCY